MNIVLIRPPKITGSFERILIQEPINLLYLATYLKQQGFNVLIWDFEAELFTQEYLQTKISKHLIDIAGITAMTPTIVNAHHVAQALKKLNPEIQTIIGGSHISALPKETLKEFSSFDYGVIGEGEIPLFNLCSAIKNNTSIENIPGIAFRKNNKIHISKPELPVQDIDALPIPDRSLLARDLYKDIYAAGINMSGKKSTVLFTSRGCSQECTFCAVKETMGKQDRFRSAENVIQELKECKEKYGYNHITFEDTNFTLNKKRLYAICQGLKNFNLTWDCQTKVSFIDEEFIHTMADSGCLKIAYGVESGSSKMLKLMKKNITIAQVKKAFRLTKQAEIVSCGFFILGTHPEETAADIKQTEVLIKQIQPDVFQLGIICPYPGTEIHDIMNKAGTLQDESNWEKFNFMHAYPSWGTKHVSAQRLVKLQKGIYLRYIFSVPFIWNLLKKLANPKEIQHLGKLAKHLISYLFIEKRH